MGKFNTKVLSKHNSTKARITEITTAHGQFTTPAFMPVATKAVVNHLAPSELIEVNSQIILGGNTYHMLCSPGLDVIKENGGMHEFMNWNRPMLTDSGGFQLFSLSNNSEICTINDTGAHFKHPDTGNVVHLTPAKSIEAQKVIGADIIMAFDECTPEQGGREAALAALKRTHQWLLECKEAHDKQPNSVYGYPQALFGIIQGGSFYDLRELSTNYIIDANTDGIAIGGESIGFDMQKTCQIMDWIEPMLPANKIRYTMGVGSHPDDLLKVVARGVDIFDCVAPTRNARHGTLYHGYVVNDGNWLKFSSEEDKARILIKKKIYAADERPILEGCQCFTCKQHTRAYLHYLFKAKSDYYCLLASIHNVHMMHSVCQRMRELIAEQSV